MGYVRGEVSGCQAKHFIDAAELQRAGAQTLHEIYAGQKGHLISYRLKEVPGGKLTDVRRTIANPHRYAVHAECLTVIIILIVCMF